MDGPEQRVQGDRGGGQLELEGGGRHAGRGVARVQVDLTSRAGQAARHWAGAVLGLDLVLLLVVEEVTSRTIGAVPGNPVFLTSLGLVFAVLAHITHFLELRLLCKSFKSTKFAYIFPMGKLAEVPIQTVTFLLEVSANLCFESSVLVTLRIVFVGLVSAEIIWG